RACRAAEVGVTALIGAVGLHAHLAVCGPAGREPTTHDHAAADDGSMTVVAVTRASARVGRATARAFAREGADVGLIARGRERLDAAKHEIEATGRRAVVAEADVADSNQVESAAELIEDELGPIDVWVNNAMATVFAPVSDTTPEEFRRATEV